MFMSNRALEALKRSHLELVAHLEGALAAAKKELAIEHERVVGLERALAVSQGNLDWMRHYANALSADRQAFASTKGIAMPAPQFEGTLQTAADVEKRALAVAQQREAGGGAPVEVGRAIDGAGDDLDAALAAYTGHVNGFEDLGDDESERQGITHDGVDGSVQYAKS